MLFLGIQDMTQRSLVRPFCDDYNSPCEKLKAVYTTDKVYQRNYDLGVYCEEPTVVGQGKHPVASRVLSATDIDLEGISFHTMGRLIEMLMCKCDYYFPLTQLIRICKVAENLTYRGITQMRKDLKLDEKLYRAYGEGDKEPSVFLKYEDSRPLLSFIEDFVDYSEVRTNTYKCAVRLLGRDFVKIGSSDYKERARSESWLRIDPACLGDGICSKEGVRVVSQLGFEYILPLEFAGTLPQLYGCKITFDCKCEQYAVTLIDEVSK